MICFEVYLNDEKLCRAGMEQASVITCNLHWALTDQGVDEAGIDVGAGYDDPSGVFAHAHWLNRLDLKAGDEIRVKIVDSDKADEPLRYSITSPEELRERERQYYESVKAKFETSTGDE